MIALGGPKLKLVGRNCVDAALPVSMIALGGPKLKLKNPEPRLFVCRVSMIALGGPKLKHYANMLIEEMLKFQ